MKRKLISFVIVLAIVLGFVGLTKLLSGQESVEYGISKGSIDFSDNDIDITDFVIGDEGYIAAENGNFSLMFDQFANPIIKDKITGREWKAVSPDNDFNSKYTSSVIVDYYPNNTTKATVYSSENSVDANQYRVYETKDGIKVEYIFGEMEEDYLYPAQISKKNMEKLFKKLSEDDIEYLKGKYVLYELSELSGENKDYLISEYPRLEKEDLYVLSALSTKTMKERVNAIFKKTGYTYSDRDTDNGDASTERSNPEVLKIAVVYSLTEKGFSASLDMKDCEFYSEYPVKSVNILPYFDSLSQSDNGYFVLPYGGGVIMNANGSETQLSFPVYGENTALSSRIENGSKAFSLPVFGQFKNDSGYFCVLDKGNQQASVSIDRNSDCSAASAVFEIIDSNTYSISMQNPVQLFSEKLQRKNIPLNLFYSVIWKVIPPIQKWQMNIGIC